MCVYNYNRKTRSTHALHILDDEENKKILRRKGIHIRRTNNAKKGKEIIRAILYLFYACLQTYNNINTSISTLEPL